MLRLREVLRPRGRQGGVPRLRQEVDGDEVHQVRPRVDAEGGGAPEGVPGEGLQVEVLEQDEGPEREDPVTRIYPCRACGRWMRDEAWHVMFVRDGGEGPALDEDTADLGLLCEVCRGRIRTFIRRRLPEIRARDGGREAFSADNDLIWGFKEDERWRYCTE